MLSKNPNQKIIQQTLFAPVLVQIINPKHELVALSHELDWDSLSTSFEKYYSKKGAPSKSVRMMASLLMLKSMYNLSDEKLVEAWIQNPYYQYFSGETHFQWEKPCHPTDLVYFRQRIGEKGVEEILKMSVQLFSEELEKESEVLVDTTCMEKNITYPTDAKKKLKIIEKCKNIAKKEGVSWRKTYTKTIKKHTRNLQYLGVPYHNHRGKEALKKIDEFTRLFVNELQRKLPNEKLEFYQSDFELFERILTQETHSKNKLYSLHEPHVACIAKKKKGKKYEYGRKISVTKTVKSGIIIGMKGYDGNPHDSKTLESALAQARTILGKQILHASVDRGYRGHTQIEETKIHIPNPKGDKDLSTYQKRKKRERCRKRAGIEPVIGHLKNDHRMNRSFLRGKVGDEINAMMAGVGFNLNKYLKRLKNRFLSFLNTLIFAIFSPIFLKYVKQ